MLVGVVLLVLVLVADMFGIEAYLSAEEDCVLGVSTVLRRERFFFVAAAGTRNFLVAFGPGEEVLA